MTTTNYCRVIDRLSRETRLTKCFPTLIDAVKAGQKIAKSWLTPGRADLDVVTVPQIPGTIRKEWRELADFMPDDKEQFSNEVRELALACCQGHWQREYVEELLRGWPTRNPVMELRGRAREYSGRYKDSLFNLDERLSAAGFYYTYYPGPRGGEYMAHYLLHHVSFTECPDGWHSTA